MTERPPFPVPSQPLPTPPLTLTESGPDSTLIKFFRTEAKLHLSDGFRQTFFAFSFLCASCFSAGFHFDGPVAVRLGFYCNANAG